MTSGTRYACNPGMRLLVAVVLLGGCVGSGASGGTRPAVMPMLSELPSDSAKRDAVLDSASTTAGPEQRQGMTTKERKAETAAATAAAILGGLFSKTQSVTIGAASQFDDSEPTVRKMVPLPQPASTKNPDGQKTDGNKTDGNKTDGAAKPELPPASDPGRSNEDLVPWIKLK